MLIVCPSCSTSYQIADAAVGAGGRSVRCARCQYVWHVAPEQAPAEALTAAEIAAVASEAALPDAPTSPLAEPAPPENAPEPTLEEPAPTVQGETADEADENGAFAEQGPAALSDIPIPVADAPPLQPEPGDDALHPGVHAIDNGPEDIESVAARREAVAARRRRSRLRVPLPLLIFVMATTCLGLFGMRKEIVRHMPQMASLYAAVGLPVNLRGLEFTNLKIGNEIHDGVPVLVVEGTIICKANMPVEVPRLRFALRSVSGAELYTWTALPSQQVLEPGQSLPFRTRLASPPAEAHDVRVRFFNRGDTAAGMH